VCRGDGTGRSADAERFPGSALFGRAEGRSQTIRPRPERHEGCSAAGRIAFAIAEPGEEPTVLGAPPHTYEVRLRLDGTEYRASAVTPRDQKFDGHPYVALTFDPPLPAL
jgi:hypothetical protein